MFNKLYVILAEENRFPEALAALWPCVTGPFLATLQIASGSKTTPLAGRLVNRAWVMSRLHNAFRSWVSRNQIHISILLENRQ